MSKEEMKKEVEKMEKKELLKKLIIEGKIVSARYGSNKFDDTNKYRIAIKSDTIPYGEIHAFDNSGSKLTPSWFKNQDGYINLSSIYEIPIKDSNGRLVDFEDWLNDYNALGSLVRVAVKQKDGALYPEALRVIEDGEDRDPFEGL